MGRRRLDVCPLFTDSYQLNYPFDSVMAVVTAFMAVAVTHLVSVKVLGGTVPPVTRSIAMMRIFTVIAVIGVVAIVDVATKVFRTMKPRAGADKDAVGKPFRAVITIRGATVRRSVVVTVRTNGRYTYSYTDLGLCLGSTCCNA
jgi:hypothetical protein